VDDAIAGQAVCRRIERSHSAKSRFSSFSLFHLGHDAPTDAAAPAAANWPGDRSMVGASSAAIPGRGIFRSTSSAHLRLTDLVHQILMRAL